ncbi:hypothetical protein LPJ61_003141 [Coemansia biformis]|uniref:Tripeptidyl-peptidase II n=1 Tax=Coemansia biformis TaxID=1286918 RepID=A0A9W7YBZ0_9FUNG|nr:hypothetical protein LPJ61_003141 [Coemansia biformis]
MMQPPATASTPRAEFPTHGLLPRADTQAADFVRKHPTYDGRGTVVAILDTGIDPGAQGLQLTSDGKRKVVDFVDCTGSGDVVLGHPQSCPTDALELRAVSGRMLRLNPAWRNPTGEWRVGAKRFYDIAPPDAAATTRSEREDRFRRGAQRLRDAVDTRKAALKSGDCDYDDEHAELDAQVSALAVLSDAYADPGPLLDCVVFHDGDQWRAAIDTAESGDLSDAPALGAYRHTADVALLSKRRLLYYTLNFYDNGRILSIVTSVGSHSTHVAGILAANHPEEPQNNGVAPGAQLLSLMIGDHRVGSMETGVGLTRAVNAIVEHRADLANMSFGEPTATPNAGQWVQAVRDEVICRHRCLFVSSAGNEGPALSTLGGPGGTTDDVIGVGAYVGYEQMQVDHGMYKPVNDTVFTWSSRGPSADGACGVDIYAPGSATASYPSYTLQRMHMNNGTSMSSPNLCGCAALLVSAWKQEFGQAERVSPYRIRNALVATAKSIGDQFGAGMVQTDAAWLFLRAHAKRTHEDVTFAVRVPTDTVTMRGIYLRNADESAHVRHMQVTARPVFPTSVLARLESDGSGEHGQSESQAQFDYELRAVLTTSAAWVQAPEAIYMGSTGNTFTVRVDPTQLEPGRLHVATIDAYDSRNVDRGPLFSVPVTVTKPLLVDESAQVELGALQFRPTDIVRRFIAVPDGATRARIAIRIPNSAVQESAPATFYLHCLQLVPHERHPAYELKKQPVIGHKSSVAGGGTAAQVYTATMAVAGGATLEVCLAQSWNQHGAHEMDVSVSFNGILPAGSGSGLVANNSAQSGIALNGNNTVERIDFVAPIRPEYNVKPTATLHRLRRALRPHSATVASLDSERDVHLATGTEICQLVLDYKLETKTDKVTLRPRMPAVDTQIYEAWMDNVSLAIFDANKRRVAAQIMYTKSVTLERRGDYLVRVQIRHRNAADLEKLKDMPLVLDIDLPSPAKLETAFALSSLLTNTVTGSPYKGGVIPRGGRLPLFFDTRLSTTPSEAAPGDALVGSLSMSDLTTKLGLTYIVPAKAIASSGNGDKGSSKKKGESAQEEEEMSQADRDRKELEEALRKVRLEWVKKAKDESVRDGLVADLVAAASSKSSKEDADEELAGVLAAQLEAVDGARTALPWSEAARLSEDAAKRAIEIADQIAGLTYTRALTARLYENQADVKSEDDKRLKKQADAARAQLVGALTAKCRARAFLATQGSFSTTASEASADFVDVAKEEANEEQAREYEKAVVELARWTETKQRAEDAKFLLATAPLHIARHHYGRALRPVLEWLQKAPLQQANAAERRSMAELRDLLLARLQWAPWSDHFRALAPIESPAAYEVI